MLFRSGGSVADTVNSAYFAADAISTSHANTSTHALPVAFTYVRSIVTTVNQTHSAADPISDSYAYCSTYA